MQVWPLCLTLGFGLSLVSAARADLPPNDFCWDEGTACENAAPDYLTAGVCRSIRHSIRVPGSDAVYEAIELRCVP